MLEVENIKKTWTEFNSALIKDRPDFWKNYEDKYVNIFDLKHAIESERWEDINIGFEWQDIYDNYQSQVENLIKFIWHFKSDCGLLECRIDNIIHRGWIEPEERKDILSLCNGLNILQNQCKKLKEVPIKKLVDIQTLKLLEELAPVALATEMICHNTNHLISSIYGLLNSYEKTPKICSIMSQFRELVTHWRFLLPLAKKDLGTDIKGEDIAIYVLSVIKQTWHDTDINIDFTNKFRSMILSGKTSTFYSVMLNLIENALYWCYESRKNNIIVDVIDNTIVIADNGPGVSLEDQNKLFQPFFSKRRCGRGIGLYSCKRILEQFGDSIEYINDGPLKILPGACFAIKFNPLRVKIQDIKNTENK